MFVNKSILFALVVSIGSVIAAPGAAQEVGTAFHFNNSTLPPDFVPCGANCGPDTGSFPIALPSDYSKGTDRCCSTFTIIFNGERKTGSYLYKSSNLIRTKNIALDNRLYEEFADLGTPSISPVTWQL